MFGQVAISAAIVYFWESGFTSIYEFCLSICITFCNNMRLFFVIMTTIFLVPRQANKRLLDQKPLNPNELSALHKAKSHTYS